MNDYEFVIYLVHHVACKSKSRPYRVSFLGKKKKKKIVVEDFVKLHAKNIRILGKLRRYIPSFYKGLMG